MMFAGTQLDVFVIRKRQLIGWTTGRKAIPKVFTNRSMATERERLLESHDALS